MRLSTRSEYGVRAMVALAVAFGDRPVSLNDIAEKENLSLSYLEQLIGPLRRAGLVTGVRGAYGGYRLARPPEQITVGEVMRPLESIALTDCTDPQASADCCQRSPTCPARSVWVRVRDNIAATLDATTLADLCHQ